MPAYKAATWCHNTGNPNLKIQALYISLNSIWHIYPLTLTNYKLQTHMQPTILYHNFYVITGNSIPVKRMLIGHR
jgi:hypothetical protein